MGKEKAGFLTPKAISNRIKAKGLQKLRWYCQMCQKQCRDDNGFKCHISSESHQRQLLLFAERPDDFLDQFSKEMLDGYIEILRRKGKRIHANLIYQEYIANRHHVHMNSTIWETLTEFVIWLGEKGYAVVDETEKGWFATYIDRGAGTVERQHSLKSKEKLMNADEDRLTKFIDNQIKSEEGKNARSEYSELVRENEEEKISLSLAVTKPVIKPLEVKAQANALSALNQQSKHKRPPNFGDNKPKLSALEEIKQMEEARKRRMESNRSLRREAELSRSNDDRGGGDDGGGGRRNPKYRRLSPTPSVASSTVSVARRKPRESVDDVKPRYDERYSSRDSSGRVVPAAVADKDNFEQTSTSGGRNCWLIEGSIVKIVSKQLEDGKYRNKKGVIVEVMERKWSEPICDIQLQISSSAAPSEGEDSSSQDKKSRILPNVAQSDLETVIPAVGRKVVVLNGAHKFQEAELIEIHQSEFSCSVQILTGKSRGRLLKLPYEDISKLAT